MTVYKIGQICVVQFDLLNYKPKIAAGQCDQIGRLLKDLGKQVFLKNSPNIDDIWAILKNGTIQFKTLVHSFGATIGKIGLLLISTFGDTAVG